MATAAATPATGNDLILSDVNLLGPIVVATDGTTSAEAAMRAAAQMALHAAVDVHVIAVLEPIPLVSGDYGLLLPPTDAVEARRESMSRRVKEQVREVVGDNAGWNIELHEGDPASVIARTGREQKARMIIMGIGHHNLIDRLFGGETALRTLRQSRVPVWSVAPTFQALPTRAVVAIDFSVASVRAARVAIGMFDSLTTLYLAHVAPKLEAQPEAFAVWLATYGEGLEPAFERIKAELQLPDRLHVETITLQGKPSRELLNFAQSTNADLIVTGSRGSGLLDRLLVGSTATGLVRGSAHSVFSVPAALGTERLVTADSQLQVSTEEVQWTKMLEAFTKRNVGRRSTLEVFDPEFGAQIQEHDYPFLGAAYDHHDRRVELML
ncbi:MAG: universal stress protein, partial [Gemmatimonadaceae bacterium]